MTPTTRNMTVCKRPSVCTYFLTQKISKQEISEIFFCGRKLGSKDAESAQDPKPRPPNYRAILRSEQQQRVPAEWLRERKERQPTFSFSKVLGAVLLPCLSLLPPPSMLLSLGVRRAHRHDDSARLRRPLRPRGHPSRAPVPLFNKANWVRARNVLKDILAGFASDPPGFTFYSHKLCGRARA